MLDIEKIKITTLSENTVADIYYVAEWGFSVHISIEGGLSILFDTGFRNACIHNATIAGIRLSEVDMILLSHGHSDHTGGLRSVLKRIKQENPNRTHVDILCHPEAIEPQYVNHGDQYFYRGCPHAIEELISLGAKFKTSAEPTWLSENILLSGEVPLTTDFESVSPICYLKKNNEYVNSAVDDDQSVFILTSKGLIIVLGCAHRGMVNTIIHAQKMTGIQEIYMIIGGTHLLNTSPIQQEQTLKALQDMRVQKVGVSHCTGMRPAAFLSEILGSKRFFFNNAGAAITFSDERVNVKAFERFDV